MSGLRSWVARGTFSHVPWLEARFSNPGVSMHGILDPSGIRPRVCPSENHDPNGRSCGMSEFYLWFKWAHVVSSTVLFGMGAGIAFFFIRARRTGDVRVIAAVAREVVFADAIFTASAVVLQPVSGL